MNEKHRVESLDVLIFLGVWISALVLWLIYALITSRLEHWQEAIIGAGVFAFLVVTLNSVDNWRLLQVGWIRAIYVCVGLGLASVLFVRIIRTGLHFLIEFVAKEPFFSGLEVEYSLTNFLLLGTIGLVILLLVLLVLFSLWTEDVAKALNKMNSRQEDVTKALNEMNSRQDKESAGIQKSIRELSEKINELYYR